MRGLDYIVQRCMLYEIFFKYKKTIMSIFSMMVDASLMIKMVMLTLFIFSLISWTIVFAKFRMYSRVAMASDDFLELFWSSKTLNDAYDAARDYGLSPEAAVFVTGFNELKKINSTRGQKVEGETLDTQLATMENLKRAVRKAQLIESERLGRSLSFLASAGSASPFIGLFGTVWGIMTSFYEIGVRGHASLAVVAPGISEALVVTAAGLAVAIPAVIFYNFFANKQADVEAEVENFSADFLNLIERNMLTRN